MARNNKSKEASSSTEESTSNSSSEDSSSTPNTPPSPPVQPTEQPRTPPQAIRADLSQNGHYSANGAKRTPRSTPTKSRLGAIEEDGDAVQPDLPVRNPLRRLGINPLKFYLPPIPTLYATRHPPKNMYDDVEGPRGEKFSDLRNNRKTAPRTRREGSWKALVCIACVILIIGAAVAIGVIVGLKVRSNKNRAKNMQISTPNPGDGTASPVGQYSIGSYLINVNSSCTSLAGTWRCAPYSTYSTSPSASYSTTNWMINATNDNRFTITSVDRTFSYPFQNIPLTKMNNGTDNELWAFTTTFNKSVFPSSAITSDGASARCFYNNTKLTGWLYTKKAKSPALQNANSSTGSSTAFRPWPYALDFIETHASGAEVPDCYRWTNGQIGAPISVPISSQYSDTRTCQCQYTNFF